MKNKIKSFLCKAPAFVMCMLIPLWLSITAFAGFGDNPQTGDTQGRFIGVFIAIAAVALVIVVILSVISAKKGKK